MSAGVHSYSYWLDATTIEALIEATCAEISATAVIALDAWKQRRHRRVLHGSQG